MGMFIKVVWWLAMSMACFGSLPAHAVDDVRPGCDSCRFQVASLDRPYRLVSNWLFTREDLAENKNPELDTRHWKVVKAPGGWGKIYDDKQNFHVGWYRGVFEFDPSLIGQEVVFLIDTYMAPIKFYLDGREIYRRPGLINVERYFSIQPVPVRFTITQARQVVAIRVETPLMAGVYQLPFELKKYRQDDVSLALYQFWGGELRMIVAYIALFFGFFFLLVYAKTRYLLYLIAALDTISLFPFFAAPGDAMLRVFSPESMLYLHYSGLFSLFFAYCFTQFFNKFTPRINWLFGIGLGAMAVAIGSMAIFPNDALFPVLRRVYLLSCLTLGFAAIYHSACGVKHGKPGARVMLFACICFIAAGLNDNLLSAGVIDSVGMLFSGVVVFTAAMLYVASTIFANTFLENKRLVKELRGLNDNLENLVTERTQQLRQKTNDIQNMLQNMPQGVLTIMDGNIIHPEYSAYLETIFETHDIAGRNLMDLLFADSNLGVDILSQVEVAASACIGQDKMNFDFNTHLMVTELQRTMDDGRIKSLELSWSPICDENDTTEKLMICVRDVTELKVLAAEANQQKRELEIIGQVLAVNQEKFHEFIDTSEKFVAENEEILQQVDRNEPGVIARLFRNMHTIKGNARTYGLLHLTNKVHETEQKYDELRKNPEMEWNKELLLAHLRETYALIQEYARINDHKLGRKGPGRRGNVDKFLMVEKERIQQSLQRLETVDKDDSLALCEALAYVRTTLNTIGADKIADIVAGIIDSLPSLAKELGKEMPEIVVNDRGILIRNQVAGLLKNVFMHLLRNSMDHGIENAEQRINAGKPAAGRIELDAELLSGHLCFRLRDDGRGLAITRIRRKAIENRLISPDHLPAPEDVAQMIFASGFSTAEKVTEVSGRGVGMDAVKGFLEREGGKIEIRFLDEAVDADFRRFETLIHLPGKFAVVPV